MSRRRFSLRAAAFVAAAVCVLAVAASAAVAPSGPPTSVGTGGAAASVETLATQAAIDTLKKGGNAIDAAVTAAGVLGVTEPFLLRDRRRWLHGHPHRGRPGGHDRRP
jgi:gamma-glutamyltranspeptidase/glutathione hydrolase